MSYAENTSNLSIRSTATAIVATSAAAQVEEHAFLQGVNVRQVAFLVTTAVTGPSAVITFYKRSAPGVTTGQVAIATLTIPASAAVGSVVYKLLDSADILIGQALAAVVTTASTAGNGVIGVDAYHDPEVVQNISVAIQSA